MSTKPLFLLRKAKKSSGEPDVVLWASNDFESTCATLDYLIVKSGKKLSSYGGSEKEALERWNKRTTGNNNGGVHV